MTKVITGTLSPLLLAMKNFNVAGLREAVASKRYTKSEVSGVLSWLAEQGFAPGVEALLPHANPKSGNSHALRQAARSGHAAVVRLLIPHSTVAINNSQAMRDAAINLHIEVVELLLPHAGPGDAGLALRDVTNALASAPTVKADRARQYLDLSHVLLPHTGMDRVVEWCLERPHKDRHLELIDAACLDWLSRHGGVVRWEGEAEALRASLPQAYVAWEAARLQADTAQAPGRPSPVRL